MTETMYFAVAFQIRLINFQSLQQVPFNELCYLALRQDRVFDIIEVYRICFLRSSVQDIGGFMHAGFIGQILKFKDKLVCTCSMERQGK